MSVHWPGENWVVICSDDEQSETMTRDEAMRYASELDDWMSCGPHRIAPVDEHGNIIGEPQRPKGKAS
jgi:hypothetical protein